MTDSAVSSADLFDLPPVAPRLLPPAKHRALILTISTATPGRPSDTPPTIHRLDHRPSLLRPRRSTRRRRSGHPYAPDDRQRRLLRTYSSCLRSAPGFSPTARQPTQRSAVTISTADPRRVHPITTTTDPIRIDHRIVYSGRSAVNTDTRSGHRLRSAYDRHPLPRPTHPPPCPIRLRASCRTLSNPISVTFHADSAPSSAHHGRTAPFVVRSERL